MGKVKQSGFTLIEVLTVAGIMALFSLTLISIFLATFRGGTKAQIIQQLHQDGDYALTTISREIRQADSVVCGASSLSLTKTDGATINFSLIEDSGQSRIASDSSQWLTGLTGSVSGLSFSCDEGSLGNQIVTIRFTLAAGQEAETPVQEKFSQDFATSVATRQH